MPWSDDGGVELVVPPGAVVWSLGGVVDDGAELSEGELADPPGDVDCCFEHADMSASALTHNNRTLRFISITSLCNRFESLRGASALARRVQLNAWSQAVFRRKPGSVPVRRSAWAPPPVAFAIRPSCAPFWVSQPRPGPQLRYSSVSRHSADLPGAPI